MKSASPQELRLAQSHTYLFVKGLEDGINAVEQYKELHPRRSLHANYKETGKIGKEIASLNPALTLTDLTLEMHDWDGVAALIIGHETGMQYALEKAIAEGAEV